MNPLDRQLQLLLTAAATAARPVAARAPFGVEAPVLAHWLCRSHAANDVAQVLLPLLRRAFFCACVLMLLSIAFSYRAIVSGENEEVAIANSTVDLTLLP